MFTNLKDGTGVSAIVDWLCANFDVSTEDDFVIEKPTTINNPAI